jgi:hypothetical protein
LTATPRRYGLLLLAGALAFASACDQPPLKEVAAAERQVDAARKEGADRYAPERLREATAALDQARKQIEAREYRAALSSASDAAERARQAAQTVKAARVVARSRADLAALEARSALDAADTVYQESLAAKVAEQAFTSLREKTAALRASLEEVAAHLQREELLEAADRAASVKLEATALPDLYRAARATWEAEHPRGGRPRARAPRRR